MITRRQFLADSAIAAASVLVLRNSLSAATPTAGAQSDNEQTPHNLLQTMRASASSAAIQVTKITDTIFLIQNVGANIVVLIGPDGKILIDSGMATGVPRLLETLTKLAPHPPRLVINTSWLFNHTDGNAALHAAGAFILAQENTRLRLAAPQKVPMFNLDLPSAPASALPQTTFVDSEKVYLDNDELDIVHVPNASTDSDVYIHFLNANVIHAGELWCNDGYPIIDVGSGGTVNGMIQGVDQVLQLADDRTKIVPSRGVAGNKAGLGSYREMLATVANRVEKLKIAGQSLDQVLGAGVTADLDSQWAHGQITSTMFLTAVYNTL
jgi:cyclase